MNVTIGLDVSLASTAICVLGLQGKIVEELQAESEPEALVRAIGALPYSIDVIGLEAGPLSQWLSKGMEEAGFDVVMMETRLVKAALKAMPIKTDRRDAQGIARLLQMGWYRPVHRKSVCQRRSKIGPLWRSKSGPVWGERLGACGPHIASPVQGALAVRPIL